MAMKQRGRSLVIHHDDLGYFVESSIAFHELPYKTGSVFAQGPCTADFVRSTDSSADLGVHLTLTSDIPDVPLYPISRKCGLTDERNRLWRTTRLAWENVRLEDAEWEFRCQINEVRRLGVQVTHIDSHMVCAMRPDIFRVYVSLIHELNLAKAVLRSFKHPGIPDPLSRVVKHFPELPCLIDECGFTPLNLIDTYTIPPDRKLLWYLEVLPTLPPGFYQIIHHSAVPSSKLKSDVPDHEIRIADFGALSDSRVQYEISQFQLSTYASMMAAQ